MKNKQDILPYEFSSIESIQKLIEAAALTGVKVLFIHLKSKVLM